LLLACFCRTSKQARKQPEDEDEGWEPAEEPISRWSWRVRQISQGAEVQGVHRHEMRRDAAQVA